MNVHTYTVERLILGHKSVYDSAEMVNSEIEQVARLLTEVAEELLPCVQPKRRSQFRVYVLSRLCAKSCAARVAYSSKVITIITKLIINMWRREGEKA